MSVQKLGSSVLVHQITDLQRLAVQAQAEYHYAQAIEHYSEALDILRSLERVDHETEFDLLAGRATCHDLLSDIGSQVVDLELMAKLAQELGDQARQVKTAFELIETLVTLGKPVDEIFTIARFALE